MPRRNRGRRVRHYNRSFYSTRTIASRVVAFLVTVGVVFGIGWFAGPHILDWGTGLWYGVIHPKPGISRPAASESEPPASSVPEEEPVEEVQPTQPPLQVVEGKWVQVSLSALGSPEAIAAAARTAAEGGAGYAIIPLKDSSGYVYYSSALPLAVKSIAAKTVDAAAIAQAFMAEGVIPVASIAAFRDPIASYTDRSIGIHYTGSDYMWLDAPADAGGKPWLNPYHADAVNYIGDMVEELAGMGYEQVLLNQVQFPNYEGPKQDFGDTAGRGRAEQLKAIVAAWKERFAGRVILWYEYSYNLCSGAGAALGATPDALAVENLFVRTAVQEGEKPLTEEAVEQTVQAMKQGGCRYVVVYSGSEAVFH